MLEKSLVEKISDSYPKIRDWARKNLTKEKISNVLKYSFSDSTALLTSTNPIFTVYEVGLSGMTDEVSIKSRLIISGATYAGLGYVYGKFRDISRNYFNITDKSKERTQSIHDGVYLAVLNTILGSGLYLISGEKDWGNLGIAVGLGTLSAVTFIGPLTGFAADAARDLFGLKKCERRLYPNIIANRSSKTKKLIAAGLIAASIGATAAIYKMTPDKAAIQPKAEQITLENNLQH